VAFDYRTPTAPTYAAPASSTPSCWSNERYFNPNTRECRACSFQPSCRDAITRNRNAAAALAPPPYYASYPVQGYAGPVPPPVPAPALPVVQPNVQPVVVRQQPPPQVSAFPAPDPYQYGWLHDPLYYALYSAPPPMVPQLGEEGFIERMGKNMARSMLISATAELFLAARQFIWAPRDPDDDNAGGGER
jgi:hypothetical protein